MLTSICNWKMKKFAIMHCVEGIYQCSFQSGTLRIRCHHLHIKKEKRSELLLLQIASVFSSSKNGSTF